MIQTLYLLLAHFIADFVLQPERIVQMKHESWKGNAIHVLIHAVTSLVLLAPFLPDLAVFAAIFIIVFAHFFIDSAKLLFEKSASKFVKPFIVDQAAHILMIVAVGYFLSAEDVKGWFAGLGVVADWYLNPFVVVGLIVLILVTYGYELLLYQYDRSKKLSGVFKPNRGRMLKNLLIWSVIYILFLVFGVYSIATTLVG